MLRRLIITNYALIGHLDLPLDSGLSIITGETGAGKSIILGALGLLIGGRADSKVVGMDGEKAIVEATFLADSEELRQLFEENNWDWEEEITIRRQIGKNGKSRGFVNDIPATLRQMQDLSLRLVDIHSQHQSMLLSESSFQQSIVDAFSDNLPQRKHYLEAFQAYVSTRKKVESMKERIAKARESSELVDYQLGLLEQLQPKEGEQEALEREFDLLNDAEEIKEALTGAYNLLDYGDESVLSRIATSLSHLQQVDMSLFEKEEDDTLAERLENCRVELKDIAETLLAYGNRVVSDRMRLMQVEQRMNELYKARQHFKAKDTDSLVALHKELKGRKEAIDNTPAELEALEETLKETKKRLLVTARDLTASREEGAKLFTRLLTETARPLGLSNLRFQVSIGNGKYTASGQDQIEFRTAFNKNGELQPMAKVASGGEASRLMLCVKALMATKMKLPTVIFDEVDTGVSGDIADRMGQMMRTMSQQLQVIAITHLPQVASKGKNHYRVYKVDEEDRTVTHIVRLSETERIDEIARMLSGAEVGNEARKNACVLLSGN